MLIGNRPYRYFPDTDTATTNHISLLRTVARGFVDRIMNNTTPIVEQDELALLDEPTQTSISEKLDRADSRAAQLCEVIATPTTVTATTSTTTTTSAATTLQASTTRATSVCVTRPAASSDAIVARHAYIIRHAPLLPNSIDDRERQSALLTHAQSTIGDDVAACVVAVLDGTLMLTPLLRTEQAALLLSATLYERMCVVSLASGHAARCWPRLSPDSLAWLVRCPN
jgi:hypothetical protein